MLDMNIVPVYYFCTSCCVDEYYKVRDLLREARVCYRWLLLCPLHGGEALPFPIRDCQRTGQWDARTRYVEETGFSTFHHPSRFLHVHALHLVHTKRWATFSLFLI
jgi:hypothetical protein